jgi:hypothetical protein
MRGLSARRLEGAALGIAIGIAIGIVPSDPGAAAAPPRLLDASVDWPARAAMPASLTWVADDESEPPLSQPAPGARTVPATSLDEAERTHLEALQGLLHRFHDRLAERFDQRMQGVAQPRLVVVSTGQPYARARQLMVCAALEHAGPAPHEESAWLGINGKGVVFVAKPDRCAHRIIPADRLDALNFLLARNNGSCLLTLVGNAHPAVRLGPSCRDRRSDPSAAVAGVVFPAAANIIEITRTLLAAAPSMEMLEAVVLHEAAHYYLAHPATWTANNAYFYFAEELHLQPGPPPPAGHALQQSGRHLVRLSRRGCNDEECLELRRHFAELGLERYTVEQAADEYTVRALLLMDRRPEALVEHVVQRGRGTGGWSRRDCEAPARRGSPSAEGWAKPHHDRCFRIHRIERYIERLCEHDAR